MGTAQPLTILAIDDNALNCKLIELSLSKEGYRVLTASNGPSGRKTAIEQAPDLILLDINMPGEDGFQVMKALQNNSHTTSIPVIFLTGVSDMDAKLAGFDLGAVDYILKPFHPLEVLARVRLHLKLSIATNSLITSQAQKLKELTTAQTALLTTPEKLPRANFGVFYQALHEAGGDFYDVLPISEDIYGYFVGDFSGHDISTSYLTSSVKALLKQNCTPIYKPIESVKLINDVLVEILPPEKYLTACYARLNRKSNQLTIISSGHPPVVYHPAGGKPRLVEMEGDVLGIFSDVWFGQETFEVSPGDRLYIYTDGVVESATVKETWTRGAAKLIDACSEISDTPVDLAPQHLMDLLFEGDAKREDDIIFLAVEV